MLHLDFWIGVGVVAGIYGIVRIVVPLHYAWNVAGLLPVAALIVTGAGYSLIIAAMALVEAVPVAGGSEREQEDCRRGGVGCAAGGFDGEAEVVPGFEAGCEHRPGHAVLRLGQHSGGLVSARSHQPQLVAAGWGQRAQPGCGEDQGVFAGGHHDGGGAARSHPRADHGGVPCGEHGGDDAGVLLVLLELVLRVTGGQSQDAGDDHGGCGEGEGEPGHEGSPERAAPRGCGPAVAAGRGVPPCQPAVAGQGR